MPVSCTTSLETCFHFNLNENPCFINFVPVLGVKGIDDLPRNRGIVDD